ncbi:copper-exporting P-type ATPase A [Methanobrevibacter cuticularis]|uniref:Copper-exporting P-type ATPase A n=1 Tax=Methanobrevibacter cuticularis TaxID=47311 RepID=A0A166CJ69_9EURY|nr:heavy metal translocating P-type ATPase [Methanobrevibacter cuticularis]KZX14777.1 copper-exporting P-type ATPase A [Methanobrevibacter cuticularis]
MSNYKKKEIEVPIDGMHCASCAINIENSLNKLDGVSKVQVDLNSNKARIEYNPDSVSIKDIDKTVEDLGFSIPKDEITLKIAGMHCANCVSSIEKALNKLNGVDEATVNLTSQKALVSYDKKLISHDEMGKAIEDTGFEYLGVDSQTDSDSDDKRYEKDLKDKLNRIIVGFVFSGILMFVMYYDFHFFYLSMSEISLLIAIIPFIYVSYPIIKAGFNSIVHKHLDMDVMYTMGILVAFVSSLLGTFNIILNSSFMFYETAIMLASFLMLGRYLETRAKNQTSTSIKQLIGLQPKSATLLIENNKNNETNNSTDKNKEKIININNENYLEKKILIEDIAIDDLLLVRPGDKIPVDGEVIDGNSYVEEAMITGEPIAELKFKGKSVFAGTINQDGILVIKAIHIGKETILSQIIDLVEKAQSSRPPVQKLADTVVKYFIPTILVIAIASFLLWYFVEKTTLLFALTTLISVLVVACPCALGLATPTAVTVGIGRAAEYGILIKNGETLETSGHVDVAIFDKTGTITEGNPEVVDVIIFDDIKNNTETKSDEDADSDISEESQFGMTENDFIQMIASLENNSTHPLANAIVRKAEELSIDLIKISDFENVTGKGLKGTINNKNILVGNKALLEEEGIFESEDTNISFNALEKYDELTKQSKTAIFLVYNESIKGIITLMDKVRPNSKATIEQLKRMGIFTLMLTGDNEKTAKNVANSVGIDDYIAEVLPNEKLEKVVEIQNTDKKGKVLFVGDGINDAPALSQADIGIALGSGTDIAMESGDVVLMEGNLENVVASIQFSNKVMTRIKENIFWAFAYNIILIPIAAGLLYPFFGIIFRPEFAGLAMALSSVTVITLSLTLKRYTPPIKKLREKLSLS